jgi:NDP-sugar pyrophosphorylase family protein
MQIIIPMSGFGERFRSAGYKKPKPLIEVNNKPIIEYVVNMFPEEENISFICNENHLKDKDFNMKNILYSICPTSKIISIPEHRLGPVHAVLEAMDNFNQEEETIVNYCDFTCHWDYKHFKEFVSKNNCDGAIPSYKGFHPHTLWNNNYAYLKEQASKVLDIQEKKPFTHDSQSEFASSGTYYYKSGKIMKDYFNRCIEEELMVGNEYYVSMPYKPMIQDGMNVMVYELNYFMQWGTPSDLEEYIYWSNLFNTITKGKRSAHHEGNLILPMAGEGKRFSSKGYDMVKPLINVSGKPMALQALSDLPETDLQNFILRKDFKDLDILKAELKKTSNKPCFSILESTTDGQATTCIEGSKDLSRNSQVTIAACDNGMNYDSELFNEMLEDDSIDIIVWAAKGYPGAIRCPENYGWIDCDSKGLINDISVKIPLSNPSIDPIVVGAFTFKKLSYFIEAVEHMKNREAKVNEEYYIDMAINDAIQLGFNCRIFEIEHYICWGTPEDLQTFEYWQSCFHQWQFHEYFFEDDPYIEPSSIPTIKEYYSERWNNRNTI